MARKKRELNVKYEVIDERFELSLKIDWSELPEGKREKIIDEMRSLVDLIDESFKSKKEPSDG